VKSNIRCSPSDSQLLVHTNPARLHTVQPCCTGHGVFNVPVFGKKVGKRSVGDKNDLIG
jgi:hypothetical protein